MTGRRRGLLALAVVALQLAGCQLLLRHAAGEETAPTIARQSEDDEVQALTALLVQDVATDAGLGGGESHAADAGTHDWVSCSARFWTGTDFDGDVLVLHTPNMTWNGVALRRSSWAIPDFARVEARTGGLVTVNNDGRQDFSMDQVKAFDFTCETSQGSQLPRDIIALTLFNLPFSQFWWGNPAFKEWRIPLSEDPATPRATNKLWAEPINSAAITLGYKDTDRWSPALWDPPLRGTTPPPFPSSTGATH